MKGRTVWFVVIACCFLTAAVMRVPDVEAKTIVLGRSKIIVPHGALVGTQVERVIRDIAWTGSAFDEKVDPARVPRSSGQLVPYMEGYLAGLLMDYASVRVVGLGPAEGVRRDGQVLADDGKGEYRFPVDPSKTQYKTVRDMGSDKLTLPDTHGFNMIAGTAMRRNAQEHIHTAIACMDLAAKVEAALYLAGNGINCFGPCDRHGYELIGYRERNAGSATIIGTAPIRPLPGGRAVIGDQEVTIDSTEPIVVQNTADQVYPKQYSDTPYRYFKALDARYQLHLKLIPVQANPGEAANVTAEAERFGARVIGVRVWDERDASAVSGWLAKDTRNRAILFHSAIYLTGYTLFAKFPKQTSFGDFAPVIM